MIYLRYFLWFIVIAAGVIFTLINARSVEIDYYFGSTHLFLPLLILLVLAIGVILGYLINFPKILKLHHLNRQLKQHGKDHT